MPPSPHDPLPAIRSRAVRILAGGNRLTLWRLSSLLRCRPAEARSALSHAWFRASEVRDGNRVRTVYELTASGVRGAA